jgi:hypothetical protein|tara:strand:- start:202 stop:321 length:120 start_codon:yes stop_codon:yes gene_type:complete
MKIPKTRKIAGITPTPKNMEGKKSRMNITILLWSPLVSG